MSTRLLRIKYESSWDVGPEAYKWRLDITDKGNDGFEFSYRYASEDEKKSLKGKLRSETVADLQRRMTLIKIPAFPLQQHGADGGLTTLEVDVGCIYSWWCSPPPEWQVLEDLVSHILHITDISHD
jgi:hypothetical protein